MKWRARQYSREDVRKRKRYARRCWHKKFALFPRIIRAEKYGEVVVPRHWLWLEHYEFNPTNDRGKRRTYRGAPTLKGIINSGLTMRELENFFCDGGEVKLP